MKKAVENKESMVYYRLRDEIMNLYVCLYNPFANERFSIETLNNFILDCGYQIEHDEQVKRFPFHLSPSRIDAERACEDMRRTIQATRKETKPEAIPEKSEEKKYSWGYGRVPSKHKITEELSVNPFSML